jgi:glc operon protein GlcG
MILSLAREIGVAGLLALSLVVALSAQLPTKRVLTLEVAKKIAAAAEAEAFKNKWSVVISIVDDGGHLIYLQRLDGTQLGSIEVSQFKARGAILYKRPTKAMEERLTSGGTNVLSLPGAAPVEGGLPLMIGDEFIGAIGVSGVTSQQDAQIAAAGAAVLAGMK